jgi:hypothetical protein
MTPPLMWFPGGPAGNGAAWTPTVLFLDPVGRPDSAPGGSGDGWVDATGTGWQVVGGVLYAPSNGYTTKFLTRPPSEAVADSTLRATVNVVGGTTSLIFLNRFTAATGNGYGCWLGGGQLSLSRLDGMSVQGLTQTAFTPTDATYALQLTCTGTLVVAEVYAVGDTTTPLAAARLIDATYSSGVAGITPLTDGVTADDVTVSVGPNTRLLVVSGDSRSTPDFGANWSLAARGLLGRRYYVVDLAASGTTLAQQLTAFNSGGLPVLAAVGAGACDVVIAGGVNDPYFGASTATMLTRAAALVSAAAGARRVVVVTPPSRLDFPGTSTLPGDAAAQKAAFDAALTPYVAAVRSGSLGAGVRVADWAADAALADVADATNYPDGVHGAAALSAPEARSVVRQLR